MQPCNRKPVSVLHAFLFFVFNFSWTVVPSVQLCLSKNHVFVVNSLKSFQHSLSFLICDFSPLDEIIDKLGGPSKVAEMTGRSGRIVRLTPQSEPRYECRIGAAGHTESLNVQEVTRDIYYSMVKLLLHSH